MKVAAIQHDIVWEDAQRTRARVRPMIASAAGEGAKLVVLAEMYATGFSMQPERIGEAEGGPNEQFLVAQAREHDVHVIASVAQRGADGKYRNNAIVATREGAVHRYAKIHPFSFAGEHERYAAGDEFLTIQLDDLRVSVFVCYDLRFADEFWALAETTDLYVVPANWPQPRHEHWRALLRARAIENQAYLLGVNRVGLAQDLPHLGGSALIDPLGERLFEGGPDEMVLVGAAEPGRTEHIRTTYPFLADRRAATKGSSHVY
jgi:predicted amidohydrolase